MRDATTTVLWTMLWTIGSALSGATCWLIGLAVLAIVAAYTRGSYEAAWPAWVELSPAFLGALLPTAAWVLGRQLGPGPASSWNALAEAC